MIAIHLRKKFISNGYNATGSSIACLNGSGIVYQYRSQSIQLEITKGMEQFSQVFRPQDISTTNTVASSKIAEAQIEYVGAGILDSASKPGWGSALFRAISPF